MDLVDNPVPVDLMGRLDLLDLQDHLVLLVREGPLVSVERVDQEERRDLLVHLDPVVRQDLQDPLAQQDHPDLVALGERLVLLGHLDLLEKQVTLEPKLSEERQDHLGLLGLQDHQVPLVLEDLLDRMGNLVKEDLTVHQVHQDQEVPLDNQVLLDLLVNLDLVESVVNQDLLDLEENQGLLEELDPQDHQVRP